MSARIRIGNQTAYSAGNVMIPFDFAIANGFDAFEWFPDKKESGAGWTEDDVSPELRARIRETAKTKDIALSVHASFAANPLTEEGRDLFSRQIAFARQIGASLINTHLYNGDMHKYAGTMSKFIRELASDGIRTSFENTVYTSPDDLNNFFRQLRESGVDSGHTGICLDLGHANLHSSTLNDYIKFADRIDPEIPIIHIHMHENYGDEDSHLTIFSGPAGRDASGIIALIERLKRRKFDGCIILEQWPWPPELLTQARSRLVEIISRVSLSVPKDETATLPFIPSPHREGKLIIPSPLGGEGQGEGIKKSEDIKKNRRNKKSDAPETHPEIKDRPLKKQSCDDPVCREFVDADRNFRSWRSKLNWINDFLSGRSDAPSLDELIYTAIYLRFIGTGQIPCVEEGGHHRPSDNAKTAQLIFKRLSQIRTSESDFVIRKIYPWLPSFDNAFMRAEPLTHIRDIAHRNDIPGELKKEIKETLQNKLHRSAGPEDLVTSSNLLKRVTAPDAPYPQAFVDEFIAFHRELQEFFNAQNIDDRLKSILRKAEGAKNGAHQKLFSETAVVIKEFLSQKENTDQAAGALSALEYLISARTHINGMRNVINNSGAEAQQLALADSGLEDFSFVLLSKLVNYLAGEEADLDWTIALRALGLNIEDLLIGGFDRDECLALESEIEAWARDFDVRERNHMLRLKATLDRCSRLADNYAYKILSLFPDKAAKLGYALGVDENALRVYAEADVRSHPVFQLSKLVELMTKIIRTNAALPAWDPIVPGRISGELVRAENFSSLPRALGGPAIAFIDRAEGDEEIPGGVKGVIVAHEMPHLSHLAVRARQGNIVFAACEDRGALSKAEELTGKQVTLNVTAEDVLLDLAEGPPSPLSPRPLGERARERGIEGMRGIEGVRDIRVQVPDVVLSSSRTVLPLKDVTPENGGNKAFKARQLAEITGSGKPHFKTPPGIVIPFGILEESLNSNPGPKKEYGEIAGKLDSLDEEDLRTALERLRQIIKQLQVPERILSEVASEFRNAVVIVRSSANCEDLEGFSGAGLYDSVANVSANDISDAVRQVWASLWNRRAAAARKSSGIPHAKAHMAVLIQQLIVPDYAFIIHTVNPLTRDKDEIYLELAAGLGETLASGQIPGNPYRMVCNRQSGNLRMLSFASFSHILKPGNAGEIVHDTADYSKIQFSVDDGFRQKIASALTSVSSIVEEKTGKPQDIEGVVSGNEIYLVQTRPQQGLS